VLYTFQTGDNLTQLSSARFSPAQRGARIRNVDFSGIQAPRIISCAWLQPQPRQFAVFHHDAWIYLPLPFRPICMSARCLVEMTSLLRVLVSVPVLVFGKLDSA
jgi:hypothetical protein